MACIIDSWVPTASITECAPSPFVSSLTSATPSSPRVVTTSVAPYSRASACRVSCRLKAMIRSAPSCRAARTPSRPTAPSPTTATVLPGPAAAATAANQPVPSTSDAARKPGTRSSSGTAGGRHQGAVGERDTQVLRLRALRPDRLPMHAGGLVAGPADRAGVVRGEERADHELTRPEVRDLRADLLHDPDVLMPHRN